MMSAKAFDNLSGKAYEHTRFALTNPANGEPIVPTLHVSHRRLALLAGFEARKIDCCVDSCMSFAPDAYCNLDHCIYCKKPRRNAQGEPQKWFTYIPFAPRLVGLYRSPQMGSVMLHRSKHQHIPGVTTDVYDGENYRNLLGKEVTADGRPLGHRFFHDERDVALGLATDGFSPFKNRRATAWPLILFNYNLPPQLRFLLDHIMCVGVIPGPRKPKDLDSFLWPLICEFLDLAEGIRAYDGVRGELFKMHAYLILGTGDMPAVASLMRMLGHNAICACRMCTIIGIRIPNKPKVTSHYVPLDRHSHPNQPEPAVYDPSNLPLRTHGEFIAQAREVQTAPTVTEEKRLATKYGIKGVPALSFLSSLSFPDSFQHGFMHLIVENLIPNLVRLWTDDFKDVAADPQYHINGTVWDAIAEAGALAGDTMPSAFGTRMSNIATDRSKFTAETWLLWATHLGPVLLRKAFSHRRYYKHFVELVQLIDKCLQLSITDAELNNLESSFIKWVQDYEK
jgi:hypothetical protein